jgi:hypothetical protein
MHPYQYWSAGVAVVILGVILGAVVGPTSARVRRWMVLGASLLFLGWAAFATLTYRDPHGPDWVRYMVRSYPYWTFAIGGAVLVAILVGMLAPISDRAAWRVVVGVSVVFLGWTALSSLTYLDVMPQTPWWLLLNATPLGLILHIAWWLVAVALVAVFWVVNKIRFPRATSGH